MTTPLTPADREYARELCREATPDGNSRLHAETSATYPDAQFCVGKRDDGSWHAYAYGIADDIPTWQAAGWCQEIERVLNAGSLLPAALAALEDAERERDMYRKLFDAALSHVDRVFQVNSKESPPILPDFCDIGEDKFAAVERLARDYARMKAGVLIRIADLEQRAEAIAARATAAEAERDAAVDQATRWWIAWRSAWRREDLDPEEARPVMLARVRELAAAKKGGTW